MGDIAPVADAADRTLDPRYITLERQVGVIRSLVSAAVWGGLTALVIMGTEPPKSWSHVLVACCAAWIIGVFAWAQLRPPIAFRYAGYRVDSNGIEIRRGIFMRKIINVPRSRVQHTDVRQGPFERHHALGTLIIHTAGAHHAIVTLPGLSHETALRIRDNLLPRGTVDVV